MESNLEVISHYADNEIYLVEMNLSLLPSDLLELSKSEDFLNLISFLYKQQILRTDCLKTLQEVIKEIQEFSINEVNS